MAAQVEKEYLDWPDAARGLSILGVLFLHATLVVPNGLESWPAKVNAFLDPMRMPLFFVVSGFLAAKVLHFTLAELLFKRVWFILIPYAIWAPVELWLKYVEWHKFLADPEPTWDIVFKTVLEGSTLMWFLYCLVVVTIIAWATRALATPWVFVLSVLPLCALLIEERPVIVNHVALYLPIFLIGVRCKPAISYFTKNAFHPLALALTALTYAGSRKLDLLWIHQWSVDFVGWPLWSDHVLGFYEAELLVKLPVRVLTLPAALLLAVAIAKLPAVFPVLRFFGRNTLVLYIGHGFGLTLLFCFPFLFRGLPFEIGAQNPLHNATVWVWMCVVFSLVGGAAFHLISKIPVLGWSVKPPAVYEQLLAILGQQSEPAHRRLLLR
ncbi:acyltransferase family protein [Corynebacterium sp. H127]|uniref:acyltransferase family protein n=1 Tax=Corynebacterium sp. H127 TaxID=3133418 RepID=UPI00309970A4